MGLEIKSKEFKTLLLEKEVLVVDFWAPWCGPCRTLGPIIEMVNDENVDDSVAVVKINVDDSTDLAKEYGVRSIPTVIYFKNGEVADKSVGITSKVDIQKIITDLK
jgi:thioredoxin 1